MNKTPQNNPPINELELTNLVFSETKTLESIDKKYWLKNKEAKVVWKHIRLYTSLEIENNILSDEWKQTYDDILIENWIDWDLDDVLNNPDPRRETLVTLKSKINKTDAEEQLISRLEKLRISGEELISLKIDINSSNVSDIIWEKQEYYIEKYETEYKKIKEKKLKEENSENNVVENNWTVEELIKDYDINNYGYQYNEESNQLFIDWKEKPLILPEEDKYILENKESTDNYVTFFKLLDDLWLWSIWKYLNNIIISLNTEIKTTWLDTKDDYLWENEQIILLNYILKSVWETGIKANNIEEFKNQYTNKFSIWWQYKNNMYKKWKSNIEELFIKNNIKNWDFKESSFIENIQKNSN